MNYSWGLIINCAWLAIITLLFVFFFIRKGCRKGFTNYVSSKANKSLFYEFEIILKKKINQKMLSTNNSQAPETYAAGNGSEILQNWQIEHTLQRSSQSDVNPSMIYSVHGDNRLNIQIGNQMPRSYSIKDFDNQFIYINNEGKKKKYSHLQHWLFQNGKYLCFIFIQIGNFYYSPLLYVMNSFLDLQDWMYKKPRSPLYVSLQILQSLLLSIYLFFMYFSYSFIVSLLTNRQEITSFTILKLNRQKLSKILYFHFTRAFSFSLILAAETFLISVAFNMQFAEMTHYNAWFWIQKNVVYLLWLNRQIFSSDFITDDAKILKNQNKLGAIQNIIDKYLPQETFYLNLINGFIANHRNGVDDFHKLLAQIDSAQQHQFLFAKEQLADY